MKVLLCFVASMLLCANIQADQLYCGASSDYFAEGYYQETKKYNGIDKFITNKGKEVLFSFEHCFIVRE